MTGEYKRILALATLATRKQSRTGKDKSEKRLTVNVVVFVSNCEVEGLHRVPGYGI